MSAHQVRRRLTRHFLRRFVDNDLLSAHADRHESLSIAGAALLSGTLFVTVMLLPKYILGFGTPGVTAITAMEDRFFLFALAMIVTALATAAQWDAMSLDPRDAAILGPLPILRSQMVSAKAAAVGLYAVGVALALTLAPAVLHPLGPTVAVRIGPVGGLRLMAAHFTAGVAAAACAFFAVLAARELLRLVLGQSGFTRISGFVQAMVVLALTTALLLVLGGAPGSAFSLTGQRDSQGATKAALPALWFLGLAEWMNGDVIVGAREPGLSIPGSIRRDVRWVALDDDESRSYRSRHARFRELGQAGIAALTMSTLVGSAAYVWNSRRLPQPLARKRARRRLRHALGRIASSVVVRSAVSRAGFFFTLCVLFRSAPHRVAMAVSMAVALALTAAMFGGGGLIPSPDASSTRVSVWALQTFVLMALAAGFRHAVAVPAELPANWVFRQAWSGDLRRYLMGVRRAAVVGIACPVIVALLPFHLHLLGAPAALFHVLTGVLIARLLLGTFLTGSSKPPFISSYVPQGNLKSLAPIYLIGALVVGLSVAAVERWAARTPGGAGLFVLVLVVLVIDSKVWQSRRAQLVSVGVDDPPEPSIQTLGLSG